MTEVPAAAFVMALARVTAADFQGTPVDPRVFIVVTRYSPG